MAQISVVRFQAPFYMRTRTSHAARKPFGCALRLRIIRPLQYSATRRRVPHELCWARSRRRPARRRVAGSDEPPPIGATWISADEVQGHPYARHASCPASRRIQARTCARSPRLREEPRPRAHKWVDSQLQCRRWNCRTARNNRRSRPLPSSPRIRQFLTPPR